MEALMDCQLIVPWGIDGNLGAAYNRLMMTVEDWVCFLDHDILNLNPHWYQMILTAIERHGHTAGLITGVTNAIACPIQLCRDAPQDMDLQKHMAYAKQRYQTHGDTTKLVIPEKMPLPFSGFMFITHKDAWRKAGGFTDGFLGVDNRYHEAVIAAGFKTYVLPGLYVFHTYHFKRLWEQL
jgi:GT2 family glycosyltransferase